MTLGFIGIGIMGEAMTRRLLDQGKSVTVWNLEPAAMVHAACQVASRNLTAAEWNEHVIGLGPYQRVCPDEPATPPTR